MVYRGTETTPSGGWLDERGDLAGKTVLLAIVLVGLYSVLGYEVTERRNEFGIRSAL